ncbi:ribonuclease H-like domain-containing protein [Gongronella butleri]|nr:ribonuclease H-like domain-containing protein [Gongronella butleri]
MEIYCSDFAGKLSVIKEAIDGCDYMAIDTELSGLHRPAGRADHLQTRDFRYQELKEASERFIVVQFGLCTFRWDEPSGRYMAQPFNFYVFPKGLFMRSGPSRVFHVQAQAFEFLAKQAFDFNKWVYQGIPYLTRDEEAAFVAERRRLMNDEMPDIHVDEKERPFLASVNERVQAWLDDKDKKHNYINVVAGNAYQRRLVYQEIRKNFPGLSTQGRKGFICIMKLTAEDQEKRNKEKEQLLEKDRLEAVGFRQVIDWISEAKKPLVGHNMLLDISHVIGQFIQPLPETRHEFKELIHDLFPIIVDTKYIAASRSEFTEIMSCGTDLDNLRFETSRSEFKNPRIDAQYHRYMMGKSHEAGYDAYITGCAFIKLMSYLTPGVSFKEEQEDEEEDASVPADTQKEEQDKDGYSDSDTQEDLDGDEVYNYGSTRVPLLDDAQQMTPVLQDVVNKLIQARTVYQYFDLLSDDAALISKPNTFIVGAPGATLAPHLDEITAELGHYIIEPHKDETTIVAFQRVTVAPQVIVQSLKDGLRLALDRDIDVQCACSD